MDEVIIINGYAYPNIAPEVLEAWLPDLTFVSNFSYGITADGGIVNLEDEAITVAARSQNVGALMVITPMNFEGSFSNELASALLASPEARANLIENILTTLQEKEMAGVDFDFEYIFEENRDQYTTLVADAARRLNEEGYIVTVALAPKTSTEQAGLLYRGHDYGGMGAAANYTLLMTYEWGYTYGPPLAVAPIDQVRRVLEYGLTQIPASKILMGIPNYGYDWKLPYVRGESRAEKVSNPEAVQRAQRYGAEIMYDEVAQAPYYTYRVATGQAEGETIYDEHIVWFEDERSMRAKLSLIAEYGLAGASFWNIMSYFPQGAAVLNEMYEIAKMF